jgi:DNA-binding CsgD family transcriptional regulator
VTNRRFVRGTIEPLSAGDSGKDLVTKAGGERDSRKRATEDGVQIARRGGLMSQRIPAGHFPGADPRVLGGSLKKSPPPAAQSKSLATRNVPIGASTTGFILMDFSENPIAFNAGAVQILSYPDKPSNPAILDAFLAKRIRSKLVNRPSASGPSSFVTAFRSGRRQYFCRAFDLTSAAKGAFRPAIAVMLERSSTELRSMSDITAQFNLTPREREVVELLLNGLTSKEIAGRMNVSANTVRAFLRLVMIKMGASTRSGILGKIMTTKNHQTP